MPPALTDYDTDSLAALFKQLGIRPAHARRVLLPFYRGSGSIDFDKVDYGIRLRGMLGNELPLRSSSIAVRRVSTDSTVKLLIQYHAGGTTEAVLMPGFRDDRVAGCVSSQIGCAMGCDFCASTRDGLERSLTAGEIVEQWLHLSREADLTGRRLASLVFMGMGEPMHNLDNVITAIGRISHPELGRLSRRSVTVSTVGIVPGIDRLAESGLNVHLALSLHAPDDATRARIVPMNRKYTVAEIVDATQRYLDRTGRIPTIEYCMLRDVNDSLEQAHELVRVLNGMRAHINLIPYNAIGAGVSGRVYQAPQMERMDAFLQILRDARFSAHFRRTRGQDVDAACGQLRQRTLDERDVALTVGGASQ